MNLVLMMMIATVQRDYRLVSNACLLAFYMHFQDLNILFGMQLNRFQPCSAGLLMLHLLPSQLLESGFVLFQLPV